MPNNEALSNNNEEQQEEPSREEVIDGIPVVPQELFDKLPPEVKQQITFLSSHQRIGLPPSNPIANKVTSEHIGEIIKIADNDSEREFKDNISTRRYSLTYFVLSLLFLTFLIVFLSQVDKALLIDVLKVFIGFLGGLGLGAYGMSRKSKKEE
jgi:hypothetical protein